MNIKYLSKVFSGAIFSGIVMLALFGISASQAMAQTSSITIKKDVCNSINPNSNACNGNNRTLKDQTLQFTVEAGTLNGTTFTSSGFLSSIPVTINLGGGSNGQTTTDSVYTTGATYRVCEIAPNGFTSTPQPNSSTGGSNQSAQGACIIATLTSGNNVLQYINTVTTVGPTAATAMIAGRVTVNTGFVRGLGLPQVTILNTRTLESQTVLTNRLGYYEFNDLPVGDTYVISARGKGYSFTPQTFTLGEDSAMDLFGSAVTSSGTKGAKIK